SRSKAKPTAGWFKSPTGRSPCPKNPQWLRWPNKSKDMTTNYSFKLVKNHFLSAHGRPVLLTSDLCLGPFHGETVLPGCTSTARDVVLRAAANQPLPSDPQVSCEDGANLHDYMLQWLEIREAEIARSKLVVAVTEGVHGKK